MTELELMRERIIHLEKQVEDLIEIAEWMQKHLAIVTNRVYGDEVPKVH